MRDLFCCLCRRLRAEFLLDCAGLVDSVGPRLLACAFDFALLRVFLLLWFAGDLELPPPLGRWLFGCFVVLAPLPAEALRFRWRPNWAGLALPLPLPLPFPLPFDPRACLPFLPLLFALSLDFELREIPMFCLCSRICSLMNALFWA